MSPAPGAFLINFVFRIPTTGVQSENLYNGALLPEKLSSWFLPKSNIN